MEQLPLDIENIILDYKAQLEHREKFQKCLEQINHIDHNICDFDDNNDTTIMYGRTKKHTPIYYRRTSKGLQISTIRGPNDPSDDLYKHTYLP